MHAPKSWEWWLLTVAALTLVLLWPPQGDKSLATKLLNWAVDPTNSLPILPAQLPLGAGDSPEAVNARDMVVQHYDALYMKGGWTRRRLEWKVADDPFRPTTTRQVLTAAAVFTALAAWRIAARKDEQASGRKPHA